MAKSNFCEWWKVRCKNELNNKYHTFKPDEENEASKINDKWWVIDAIGISAEDFDRCFEKIEEIER